MNTQKTTSKRAPRPHDAPRGKKGLRHYAPRAPSVYIDGAVGHEIGGATRNKIQVVKNYTYGENARGAKLTDAEVELIRQLHEEYPRGHPEHLGYRRLAVKFGVSRNAISNYCRYLKRIGPAHH